MEREVDDDGALIASLMIPEKKRKRKRDQGDDTTTGEDKYVFLRNVMLKIEETEGFGMVVLDWDSSATERPCRFFMADAKFGIARCQKEDDATKTWKLDRVSMTEDEKEMSEARLKRFRSGYEDGEEEYLKELNEEEKEVEDDEGMNGDGEATTKEEEVEEDDDDDLDDEFK